MLYILKLVCLLLKYKKIGYVVNIETSIFSTEKKRQCCTFGITRLVNPALN